MSDKGMTTMKVKQINKHKVYQYIYESKTTCKLDITRALQMGISTVTQNLRDLEQEGLICKNGFFDSTGGRKADAVEIVADAKMAIGVAILKESIDIVAINLYGEMIHSQSIPLIFDQADAYFQAVSYHLYYFIDTKRIANILGVSFAMQGIISKDGKEVSYGAILSNERMLLSRFSQFISYPCRMEHDSKAAAELELWKHKHIQNATLFLLNLNLGGAIIVDGAVHNGNHMHAGVIEHICVEKNGLPCYCGNRGCLESYCSAQALKQQSGMEMSRFFDLLLQGDQTCKDLWYQYLDKLAYAISLMHTLIDGHIIISGQLAWYFTKEDIAYLLKTVNQTATFKLLDGSILLSTHGRYTQSIGTALYDIKAFLQGI